MSNQPYYDVCTAIERNRGGKKTTYYHRLGRAYVTGSGERRSLTAFLESAPFSREMVLFPPDGQEPIAWPERFNLSMPVDRGEGQKTWWHNIGVAFYNAPKSADKRESITAYLDSIPLAGRIGFFEYTKAESDAA